MLRQAILLILAGFLIFLANCGLLGGDKEDDSVQIISGKIVFSMPDNSENENYQIFVMNADGSDLIQLTSFENQEAVEPSWSSDGEHIVFTSTMRSTSLGLAIHIMDANGENIRPMKLWPDSLHAYAGSNPVWSPDGTEIAYDWCVNCELQGRNSEIFIYDIATDSVIQITDHPAGDTNPTWNPDGSKIAFKSQRDYYNADTLRFRGDLYTINIDVTELTRLTESGYTNSPSWAPNNDIIIFRNSNVPYELWEVNINTKQTNKIDLSLSEDAIYYPLTVSPDYSKLLVYKYGLSSPHDNSMLIWNLYEDSYKSIFSKPTSNANQVINGADWYYPKTN